MKSRYLMLATALVVATQTLSSAQRRHHTIADESEGILSRVVKHANQDGIRSVMRRDTNNRTVEKQTLTKSGVLIMHTKYQLDEMGKERNGLIYDGQGRLLHRVEFIYDRGELHEERLYTSTGDLQRRVVYRVDSYGRRKPFALSYVNGRAIGELSEVTDASQLHHPTFAANVDGRAASAARTSNPLVLGTSGARASQKPPKKKRSLLSRFKDRKKRGLLRRRD